MRVALKIAYDGRGFYGHQRQPDRRTVEGECITALRSAKIIRDPMEAFFRSASRTDRGVSAVGNVIAFNTSMRPEAVVGAFNDKARDVWGWAIADVADSFHPRHAMERWYRYTVVGEAREAELREAGSLFVGAHDFRSFCSEPLSKPLRISRVDVTRTDGTMLIDVRAPRFGRGMVRRLVAAMLALVEGDAAPEDVRDALSGAKRDFGSVPPEALALMDVRYGFPFRVVLKPKVVDEWRGREVEHLLGLRLLRDIRGAAQSARDPPPFPTRATSVE